MDSSRVYRRQIIKTAGMCLTFLAGCTNSNSGGASEPTLETITTEPLPDNPIVNEAQNHLDSFLNELNSDLIRDTARIMDATGELVKAGDEPLRIEANVQYEVKYFNEEQFQDDLVYGVGSVAFLYAEIVRKEDWQVAALNVDTFKQGEPHIHYVVYRTDAQAANRGDISDNEFIERVEATIERYE